MISVVILTLNEEHNIGACIDALYWCDDIHIIDGGSVDNTMAIAQSKGARVHVNRFVSFAQQRNWALEHCPLKHEWVLHMDADERATDSFYHAMMKAIRSASPKTAGFYCCWKLMLDNQWLKRSDCFPQWQFRLLRKTRACFIDYGDAQKDAQFEDDQLNFIQEPFLHYAFSKGWSHWLEKRNKYSTLKAQERVYKPLIWRHLFSTNRYKRSIAYKILLSKTRLWPLMRFVYWYFLCGGFLEGGGGFIYCCLKGYEELIIQLKMKEYRQIKKESKIMVAYKRRKACIPALSLK